jgi:membrane fusion protein (multidrug efflux system)
MLLAACGKKEEAAAPVAISVKAMKVARGDVPIMKEAVGQLKGAVDAEIRARVEGVVTSMSFQEGKEVTEGQLLYTIDPAPYEAKVAEANGKLAEATTRLAEAESDLKRVRPLVEMKALSARDLDAAVANEGAARGAVDAAKASVEAAQIELGYCKITAPVSGTIGLTKAKVGEFVGRPPNPVVLNTVSQLDPIHVRFALSEQDYLYFTGLKQKEIASGAQPVARKLELILADGSLYPEKGEVISMAREIDPQTGSFALEAAFPNPHKLLRPGQYGKIRGVAETLSAVLVIPKRAIRELQGQNQVFVVKGDKTVEARTITLGAQVGELQAVQSGLNEGEIIVVDGIQRLKSGMPVAPEIQESNSPAESEK